MAQFDEVFESIVSSSKVIQVQEVYVTLHVTDGMLQIAGSVWHELRMTIDIYVEKQKLRYEGHGPSYVTGD